MAKKRTTSTSTKSTAKTPASKTAKTTKTVEGEGNRTADRNYRKGVREFAKTNNPTAIARKAAKEIDAEEASAKPATKAKPMAKTEVKAEPKTKALAKAEPQAVAKAAPKTAKPKTASRSFLSIAVQQIRDSIGTAVQMVKRAIEPKARVTSR